MDNQIIHDLIDKCWLDTTGLQIESTQSEDLTNSDELYIASVVFTGGDNQGSLTVAMGEDTAKQVAANMFDTSLDTVEFEDIKDSIGELANVIAGNMKSDLFGNSDLSKPLVMQGNDSILTAFKVDAIFQKVFVSSNKEQLVIQVCHTS